MNFKPMPLFKLAIFLGTVWTPLLAQSAPNIKNVIVDQSNGGSISIAGSDFHSTDFPIILDTADSWQVVQENEVYSTSQPSELWSTEGSAWASPLEVIPETGPFNGTQNSVYYGKRKSYNGYFAPFTDEQNRSIYVSWWFKPTQHPYSDGGSNKFIRIWDEDGGENTRISWTSMHLTYKSKDIDKGGVSWTPWPGNSNQWHLMEIYVNADSNIIKTWVDGELVHDVKDFEKSPTPKGLNVKLIGFDPSVSTPYENLEFNIDNVYVGKTPARVVASVHENWTSAKKHHRALFPTKWTSEQINVDVDVENLLGGKQDYFLYVIDKMGNANSIGAPVCPQCPAKLDVTL